LEIKKFGNRRLTVDERFKKIVSEDTPQMWMSVKEAMPWGWALTESQSLDFPSSDLELLEIDCDDSDAVLGAIADYPNGEIFGEFEMDPSVEVNSNFDAYVMICLTLAQLPKGSTPSTAELTNLYRADSFEKVTTVSPISFLVIVCPRCQLRFTAGDEDVEFTPDDCRFDDCIACDGTGEWEYEF
jgi:hypothetical protein